ncbi:hypothetical protein [Amycolatopsis magusensis]|uniref:hypothetical protein n=1 Tax=Amycolatopsis magusensis TaxID=882444 RepID=UPI003C2B7FC6
MVASNQIRPVEQLLDRASELRLRAPELALVLGERAASLAEAAGSDQAWLRAESLVVFARVRLGDRASVTARTVAALRSAEHLGYSLLAARLRTDLAVCARSVGMPLTGLALLRPVLAEPGLTPGERATALCHLVGCMAQLGRKQELDRVLLEADRLCLSDESSDGDSRLVMRSLVRVGMSGHRRRHGDLTGAADAARTGLGFIEQLRDPSADGGLARSRLVLQLVCTLLDRGNIEMALELAEPVLDSPPRAGVIGPASWLRLAVATRVHLSTGAPEAAGALLREAVYDADRHGLHSLTAKLLLELAHVEERLGRPADALECLRRSRAAEQVHLRMRRQACAVLGGEFGGGEQAPVDLTDVLARSPRGASGPETTVIPRITDSTPPPGREVARPPAQQQRVETPRPQTIRVEAPRLAAEEMTQTLPRYEPQPAEVARVEQVRHQQPAAEQPVATQYQQAYGAVRYEAAAAAAAEARYQQPAGEPVRYEQSAEQPRYQQPAGEAVRYEQSAEQARYQQAPGEPARYEQSAEQAWYQQVPGEQVRYEQPAEAVRYQQPAAEAGRYAQAEAQYGQPGTEAARYEQPPQGGQPGAEAARYQQPVAERRYEQPGTGSYQQAQYGQPAAEAGRYQQAAQYGQPAGEPVRYQQAPAEAPRAEQVQPVSEAPKFAETARYEQGRVLPPEAMLAPPPAEERQPAMTATVNQPEPEPRKVEEPHITTRHDSEHGSVAARSVLDRLGVSSSGGGGGGRRRAGDKPAEQPQQQQQPEEAPRPEPEPEKPAQEEGWLPKLRLPPSLAPVDEYTSEYGRPNYDLTNGEYTPPAPPADFVIPSEDPPPDAGLAELLALALAEHRAGTSSAAALVKRLGSQSDGEQAQPVNGSSRRGEYDHGRRQAGGEA